MAIKSIIRDSADDVVFLADAHFGAKSASVEWADNMVGYFDNFFIPLLRREIETGRTPVVVVAGDFFDNRQHIDIDIMNRAIDVVEKLASVCEVVMSTGNHDIYKKNDTDVTSLRVFERIPNVTVLRDKAVLNAGGKSFLIVPWIGDFSKESKFIVKNKDKYDYIVMHTEISGMSYDNNRPIVNGLNLSGIDDNCRIISGHIHKRQSNSKAMYLGSPYMMTKSDVGNEKGVYCFRIDDGKVSVDFTQNDYSPKFLKVDFAEYGKKPENWEGVVRNNYVEIVFEEEELNRFNVYKFSDELQRYEPRKIEFSCRKKEKPDESPKYSEDATISDVFAEQVSEKGLDGDRLNEIINMNNEYIKRAEKEAAQ